MSYLVVTLNWLALFTEIPLMSCLSEGEPTVEWGERERADRPRGKRQDSKEEGRKLLLDLRPFIRVISHIIQRQGKHVRCRDHETCQGHTGHPV